MADGSEKLLARLATLNDSLDDLEEKLEPLLSQTLPESLLPLETIQQVKLNVAIPYLVYDLVFIYLKTRGIDPKTHPVVAELDRVRQYFDKIKKAEDPEQRKTAVDKAAANRFIKHAIAQAKESAQTPGAGASSSSGNTHIRFDADGHAPASSTPRAPPAPGKVTSKMLARAEWQRKVAAGQVASEDEDEDEDEADALEVFDDEGGADEEADEDEDAAPETVSSKAKGKGRATEGDSETDAKADLPGGKKRRRGAVDPFAGYGDEPGAKPSKSSKKQKSSPQAENEDVVMDDEPTSGNSTPKSAKRTKNAEKKAKKRAKKASLG